MSDYTAIDPEGTPLTAEQHMAELIEAVIARWIETGYKVALAGTSSKDDGAERRAAFDSMRWGHYAEPWLPAHTAAKAIAKEVLPALTRGGTHG